MYHKALFQFRKVQLIQCPQGWRRQRPVLFQFRKVQLILPRFRSAEGTPRFQFRKVQLIRRSEARVREMTKVSIPQGPINTLSSIQQSPL